MTDTTQAAGLTDEQGAFRDALAKMPAWAPEFEQHRPWVEMFAWNLWLARAALAAQAVPAPYRFVEALRAALDRAGATEKRAEIVGHFCNGLNALFSAAPQPPAPSEQRKPESKLFVVLNSTRTEGFLTDSYGDARHAATGRRPLTFGYSTLAEAFRDCYGDDGPYEVREIDAHGIRSTGGEHE